MIQGTHWGDGTGCCGALHRRVIRLTFSLPPAGLRRNHPAGRYAENALKDAYSEKMYLEMVKQCKDEGWPSCAPQSTLAVSVVWRQCGAGDVDNAARAAIEEAT